MPRRCLQREEATSHGGEMLAWRREFKLRLWDIMAGVVYIYIYIYIYTCAGYEVRDVPIILYLWGLGRKITSS